MNGAGFVDLEPGDTFSGLEAKLRLVQAVVYENRMLGLKSPITNIVVIILIGQEKIHLKRCIEKLAPLNPQQIFLVESQPDDGGVAIAKETAAKLGLRLETRFNKWPGNQAVQFNWALGELVSGFKFQVSGGGEGFKLQVGERVSDSKFQVERVEHEDFDYNSLL